MIKEYGAYTHARPNGVVFYVGKGTRSRAGDLRRNSWHLHIVEKYGKENILIEFYPCNSEKEAFEKEIELIKQYKAKGTILVNHTNGGEGMSGYVWSKEQITKQAKKIKEVWKNSELRENYCKAHREKWKNPEYREKQSISRKGAIRKEETKIKISLSLKIAGTCPKLRKVRSENSKNLWKDPEYRKKMLDKMKNLWTDPEYRQKMSEARKKGWQKRRINVNLNKEE